MDEHVEGADLHEALTKTRLFLSVAYFLSNSLAIELLFSVANSHLLLKMGIRSRQENYGSRMKKRRIKVANFE